jgi:phosphoenolpyruvate carboxykinase (ATP)
MSAFGLERHGFTNLKAVHRNLTATALYEEAVRRGEGHVANHGPLVVLTGQHTGRSALDKFTVRDAATEDTVWWDSNKAMTPAQFDTLHADMMAHAQGRELFAKDVFGGADRTHRIKVRVVTEYAWHSLFVHQLLIRPTAAELQGFDPEFTIIDLPGFEADPARHGSVSKTVIAVNFTRKMVLIGGTSYAGEMKKSVFTIMNYLLPAKGVMSMHCSANVGADGESAIFFGLSGTGKTTLSADASRTLVGDDEHGWSEQGVFNIEGGCYAKVIRLSREAEPEIHSTTERFGTVLENVVMDPPAANSISTMRDTPRIPAPPIPSTSFPMPRPPAGRVIRRTSSC